MQETPWLLEKPRKVDGVTNGWKWQKKLDKVGAVGYQKKSKYQEN
jgi:hypothetical protein